MAPNVSSQTGCCYSPLRRLAYTEGVGMFYRTATSSPQRRSLRHIRVYNVYGCMMAYSIKSQYQSARVFSLRKMAPKKTHRENIFFWYVIKLNVFCCGLDVREYIKGSKCGATICFNWGNFDHVILDRPPCRSSVRTIFTTAYRGLFAIDENFRLS